MFLNVDTTTGEDAPQHSKQLYDDHVVGEDVRVTHCHHRGGGALLPRLLEAVMEDKDAQRDEEEDVEDEVRFRFETRYD